MRNNQMQCVSSPLKWQSLLFFLINSHFQLLPWLQNSDNLTQPTRTITFPLESDYLLPAVWPCSDQQRERFSSLGKGRRVRIKTLLSLQFSPEHGQHLISARGLHLQQPTWKHEEMARARAQQKVLLLNHHSCFCSGTMCVLFKPLLVNFFRGKQNDIC